VLRIHDGNRRWWTLGAVVPQSDPRFAAQFLHGFHDALLAGAGIALVGALLSTALVRRVRVAPRSGRLRVAPNE
jgi:hypothetical protein